MLKNQKIVELELTTMCNARCIFCPRELFKNPIFLSRKMLERVIKNSLDYGIDTLKLAGMGEATLHPKFVTYITELKKSGLKVILNTNGVNLNQELIRQLVDNVDEFRISLHALDREIYKVIYRIDKFDKVYSNIEFLVKNFSDKVCLYTVINKLNKGIEKKIKSKFNNVRVIFSGCTNRALDIFNKDIIDFDICTKYNHYPLASLKEPYCGYAMVVFAISANGDYLLCTNDMNRNNRNIKYNIFEKKFKEIENYIKKGFEDNSFLPYCKTCDNWSS